MRNKTIFASCLAVFCLAAMLSAQCGPPMPLGVTEGFEAMGQDTTSTLGCGAAPAPLTTLPTGWTHGDLPAPFPPPPTGAAASNWFRSDSGGTPSGGTGPSVDVTLGTSSGTYLYLETSGSCGSAIAYLNAPPFSSTGLTQPAVEFWYHMFGTGQGTLKVDVFDGAAWQTVWVESGNHGNVWNFVQVPLNILNIGASQTCAGEIDFRITGIGGGSFTSDMAIDEVRFGEATIPPFDTNTLTAAATIDGVVGNAFFPTLLSKSVVNTPCVTIPAPGTAEISTSNNPGALFDVILSSVPIVGVGSPGSLNLGAAKVNLNIFAGLSSMNGPGILNLNPFPGSNFPGFSGGSVNIPFAVGSAPQTISMQALITNAAATGGFELSQATQLDLLNASNAVGPNGDEVSVALDVVNAPFCWTPSGIPFYGTLYTTVFMQSNGRLRFDTGATDFSPSAATASGNIMAGLWSDFNTSGGQVTASSPAPGVVRIDYVNVAYFGAGPTNTFAYILDANTGDITIDGLLGVDMITPTSSATFLGISPGNMAVDPGPVIFTAGSGVIPGGDGTVMTYDAGANGILPASINGVLNQVIFHVNAAGGYDFEGL